MPEGSGRVREGLAAAGEVRGRARLAAMTADWSGHLAAPAMTLAEQTAARLAAAGFTWDDPALARIAAHNREVRLRAELAAWKAAQSIGHPPEV